MIEVLNEPNTQNFPQYDFSINANGISACVAAQMMQTASAINAGRGKPLEMAGPATNDKSNSGKSQTDWYDFVQGVISTLTNTNTASDARFIWTQHTYHETGQGLEPPNVSRARDALVGKWRGWGSTVTDPEIWCTEGGLQRYPDFSDPSYDEYQKAIVQAEWERLHDDTIGGGRGVGMLTNYLFYTRSKFDTGLCNELASGGSPRLVYDYWKSRVGVI